MTVLEAAKIIMKYGDGVYERPNTCYGGTCGVLECTCCGNTLNVYPEKHKPDCQLELARKTINEAKA